MVKSCTTKMVFYMAAATISGLVLASTPSSASPLAPGQIGASSAMPMTSGLLEKAYYRRHHHRHYVYYRYRHRHHYYPYYAYSPYSCDGYYGGYYGDCGYPYYRGYGFGFPFVSFGFGFGGHHHHRHW